jgi:hypothetical protein
MKIYVGMGAADINSILIVREGNLGRYCVRIKNVEKSITGDFPMPEGNGILELNI